MNSNNPIPSIKSISHTYKNRMTLEYPIPTHTQCMQRVIKGFHSRDLLLVKADFLKYCRQMKEYGNTVPKDYQMWIEILNQKEKILGN